MNQEKFPLGNESDEIERGRELERERVVQALLDQALLRPDSNSPAPSRVKLVNDLVEALGYEDTYRAAFNEAMDADASTDIRQLPALPMEPLEDRSL